MKRKMGVFKALVFAGLFLLFPSINALCARAAQEGKPIMVPMPRLKISGDWLRAHPSIKIPQNLISQTVSLVATSSGTTLVQTINGKYVRIDGILEGNDSRYESDYDANKESYLSNEFQQEAIESSSFETLNLPPFRPFFGAFKGGAAYGGGFPYSGANGGIDIMAQSNWTKSGIRPGPNGALLTVFTVPIQLFNKTPADITDFSPRIYLEDRDGNKYFPDPKNTKQGFYIAKLPSRKQIQINVQIEAPADDFYLRPKIETNEHSLYLGVPIGPYDWAAKATEKKYSYPTPEEIETELIK